MYRTIEEMSPPDWSVVFTNVLTEGHPEDEAIVHRLAQLAARRGCRSVPVHIRCSRDEILRRVPNADRRRRMKWIDREAVMAFMAEHEVMRLAKHDPFQIDVTAEMPADAARRILDHIDSLG